MKSAHHLIRIVATLGLGCCAAVAGAQTAYPDQPIKVIVPFPPAGGTDVLTRLITNEITLKEKWTFIVDNRPGAGGNIGLDAVAKSRKDGYTLGTGQTANLAINPTLYPKLPYDPIKDFVPVILLASQPVVLVVRADSPIKTLADLKTRPAPGSFPWRRPAPAPSAMSPARCSPGAPASRCCTCPTRARARRSPT